MTPGNWRKSTAAATSASPARSVVVVTLIVALLFVFAAGADVGLDGRTTDSEPGPSGSCVSAQAWNMDPMIKVVQHRQQHKKQQQQQDEESDGRTPNEFHPEYPEIEVMHNTHETGFSLSGGGARAYTCSLGYLRGLLDANLLNRTRYVSSVSGGSWANAAFTYYQPEKIGLSDADFLGEIIPPEKLTMDALGDLDEKCARASPVKRDLLEQVALKLLWDRMDPPEVYPAAIWQTFLEPAGIEWGDQAAWSTERRDAVVARNPVLKNQSFVIRCGGADACSNRPFSIVNAAILGPLVVEPFSVDDDNYVPIEFNALYVGSPQYLELKYAPPRPANLSVGGYVETFAFGGVVDKGFPGLGPFNYTTILQNVPMPEEQFSLGHAVAASSFAPGSFLSGSPLLAYLDNTIGMRVEYWSPVTRSIDEPVRSQAVLVSDAASLENLGILALLRRRLREVVVFIHSPIPLSPRSRYNPFQREPGILEVDPALTSLFGVDHEKKSVVENLFHNQVFPRFQLVALIDQMQQAQAKGRGIVVRQALRTIENTYWGIGAGHDVNVTWVYLSRALEWERRLPEETRKLVQPRKHVDDPTSLRRHGPFTSFPHIPTSKLHYSAELANLLANLAGWVFQQNIELFEQALDPSGWADRQKHRPHPEKPRSPKHRHKHASFRGGHQGADSLMAAT
ncbi:Hypothetical Protein FCC1311_004292 [Hondaea fermentalgiana]|uniref:Uncharacterized protein n=1 Tax=Hondaea fermentalgiana TaxID=2315210 RepID=A0A2R5G845_9STRA|nr:Hypothetical Protein FCC1311_004292 [Hondaea fermentalgiana]|eukprot:GBG24211.1 Hypothetical Protein FCC1311_004292 [Hondaea fermentalgiana]